MTAARPPTLNEEILSAAGSHAGDAPGYLERIRSATGRLAARDTSAGDAWAALATVEDHARVDVDVPIASRRRELSWLKGLVKRLTAWYLGYLGHQVTLLGESVVRFGGLLVQRTEELEESTGRAHADIQALAERIERLEHRLPAQPAP